MSLLVKKSGILTTVQDLGRFGYRRFGINTGGAMDRTAVRLINLLLGNNENAPVVEMHFPAAEIEFEADCEFALGGADHAPSIDSLEIENWRVRSGKAGSVLRFAEKRRGARSYLAVRGGFEAESWLGSSSTNLTAGVGGHSGRRLQNGDRLATKGSNTGSNASNGFISPTLIPRYSPFPTLRVTAGHEIRHLKPASQAGFGSQEYTITNRSDRMGYRLSGEQLFLKKPAEMISSAVTFGTIQLLPDGQMVILMADHQTAGGYPRVAHVIERDLPVAAQLGPSDKVAFRLITLAEAEALYFEQQRDLALLRTACLMSNR